MEMYFVVWLTKAVQFLTLFVHPNLFVRVFGDVHYATRKVSMYLEGVHPNFLVKHFAKYEGLP